MSKDPKPNPPSLADTAATARMRGQRTDPTPPAPPTASTLPPGNPSAAATQPLDLAAIAELLRPHLEQPKSRTKAPTPPKAAARRPNPSGGQHQAPGLGWSTAWVLIVGLLMLAAVVLGLGLAYLHVL